MSFCVCHFVFFHWFLFLDLKFYLKFCFLLLCSTHLCFSPLSVCSCSALISPWSLNRYFVFGFRFVVRPRFLSFDFVFVIFVWPCLSCDLVCLVTLLSCDLVCLVTLFCFVFWRCCTLLTVSLSFDLVVALWLRRCPLTFSLSFDSNLFLFLVVFRSFLPHFGRPCVLFTVCFLLYVCPSVGFACPCVHFHCLFLFVYFRLVRWILSVVAGNLCLCRRMPLLSFRLRFGCVLLTLWCCDLILSLWLFVSVRLCLCLLLTWFLLWQDCAFMAVLWLRSCCPLTVSLSNVLAVIVFCLCSTHLCYFILC